LAEVARASRALYGRTCSAIRLALGVNNPVDDVRDGVDEPGRATPRMAAHFRDRGRLT